MQVCIVTTAFPRWRNDSLGTFVFEAARALSRQGVKVNVVALHAPHAKVWENMEGINVYRPRYLWPENLEILQKYKGGLPTLWAQKSLGLLAILPFVIAHILGIVRHAGKSDLIHANWTLSAICVWLSQPFHRKPFFVTVQGSDIYQATKIVGMKYLTRLALNRAKCVFALSHSLAAETKAIGVNTRILVVPNGVDTNEFVPGDFERKPLILFVGSLIKRKGADFLISAMPKIIKKYLSHTLVIVGEGPLRMELERLVLELKLQNKVEFTGDVSPEAVKKWMQLTQVFVLPSLEEGLGVVILEALACGVPCIGSDVGGISDSIRAYVNGLLIPPGDWDAIATGVDYILSDPVRWQNMSYEARRIAVMEYDWNKIAQRLIAAYLQDP